MLISKTINFEELEYKVCEITRIDHSTLIKMKFILYSYYEFDLIDIKKDNDVYYFVVEQVNREKMQRTLVFVKMVKDVSL